MSPTCHDDTTFFDISRRQAKCRHATDMVPLSRAPKIVSPGARDGNFGARILLRSPLTHKIPKNDTSTTPTMAGSLRIAAPTTPNPTNTLTNAFATAGGVDGVDSVVIGVKITAGAAHKCTNDGSEGHFTSVGMDRGIRGPQKQHTKTQQSIGKRAGV